jgi:riboflavin kinase/FMN adenylyltransferase
MHVHKNIDQLPGFKKAVITTGTFDGVHRGHQELISRINGLALETGGESVLVTFDPHPRMVVYPADHSLRILSTLEEKIELLEKLKIDHLVIVPFTKEFSLLSARDYTDHFLVGKFKPAVIVIGYNHQFGHHRDGNIELLRKLAPVHRFRVEQISKQLIDDIEVSSTRIRIALQEGDVKTASHLLGHHYSLRGTVEKGNQLGRKLGFPTANISISDPFKLIPADGIYAVKAIAGGQNLQGALSIGFRPTVNGTHRTVEVFLLDFNQDIYNEPIQVEFVEWIREEKKYETLDLLINEMHHDVKLTREVLSPK